MAVTGTAGNARKVALVPGNRSRIQNVTGDQNVKTTPGVLWRIVVTNAAAAVGSFTLKDGATVLGVFEVGVDTTLSLEFNCPHSTSIVIAPSATTMDLLVMWD